MRVFTQLMMRKKIPAIYKVLDWIQSDENSYIDTSYVVQEDDVIETDVQYMGTSDLGDRFLFGQQSLDTSKGGMWVEIYDRTSWYVRFGSTSSVNAGTTTADTTDKIHITLKKGEFKTSGGRTLAPVYNSLQSTNLTLFCRLNSVGTPAGFSKLKMWNFYITRNGATKLNLIPVRRLTDNVCGMYDTVSKTFFGNAGTGKFIGSDE